MRATIERNVAAFERCAVDGGRRAAVALCVLDVDADGDARLLIGKRVARGRNPGQWALPGGKVEPGETAVAGALRELEEEAGVAGGTVAGLLDDFVTDSGFCITPVVVLAAPGSRPRRGWRHCTRSRLPRSCAKGCRAGTSGPVTGRCCR